MLDHAATESVDALPERSAGASIEAGKLVALGRLAAGAAHEINNPLFAILGFVEFLVADAEPGTKTHERLTLVQQCGLEIKEIVRAMLEFAREPSDAFDLVSLDDLVGTTAELVRRTTPGAGPEIVVRLSDEDTPVCGSPNQLKQALLHEIARAQRAAGEAGMVAVEVGRQTDWAEVVVSSHPATADGAAPGDSPAASVGGEIARAHGGDLAVSPGKSVLRLPLAGEHGGRRSARAA